MFRLLVFEAVLENRRFERFLPILDRFLMVSLSSEIGWSVGGGTVIALSCNRDHLVDIAIK